MDTISRENNSYLPLAGVIVGVLALVLAAVTLAKVSSTSKALASHTEQLNRVETLETEVRTATAAAEKAVGNIGNLQRSMQSAFDQVALELGNVKGEIAKVQESAKAPARAAAPAASGAAGAAKAAPAAPGDEYVVKGGDSGAKIARSHNVSLSDLMAVNPSVNWNRLKPGDKVKLPKR